MHLIVGLRNPSGQYELSLDNIVVIHDDAYLEIGRIKIKKGGKSAGHNRLKSIDKSRRAAKWRALLRSIIRAASSRTNARRFNVLIITETANATCPIIFASVATLSVSLPCSMARLRLVSA